MIECTNIDRNLKVGSNCYHMNVSAIYELYKSLYLSFAYTNFDFIYNKDTFLEFENPKPPSNYISKENDLLITKEIGSVYMKDYYFYMEKFTKSIYEVRTDIINPNGDIDFRYLKDRYLCNGTPIFFPCDIYYMYFDYKKIAKKVLHFHTGNHMAILMDIDFQKEQAFIIDKFYSFMGIVKLDNFINSLYSDYIKKRQLRILTSLKPSKEDEETAFQNYFKKSLILSQNSKTNINNVVYYKNVKALEMFNSDFEEIISNLNLNKGKYSPQFLTKLISNIILQKMSFCNLLGYYNKKYPKYGYDKILQLAMESSKMWRTIDLLNDKTYLSKKTLLINKEKYKTLLNNLIIIEKEFFSLLNELDLCK